MLKEIINNQETIIADKGGSGEGDMKKSVYDSDLAVANAGGIGAFVSDAVSGKVDKVEGKGLSTNDYSDTEKGKVADNTSAIEAIKETMTQNGAHNHLPYDITTIKANNTAGTWSGDVFTPTAAPNLTFTLNSNGSVTINGANGSSNTSLFLIGTSLDYTHAKDYISAGDYIVSGNIGGYITNDSIFVTLNGYYSNNTDAYYGSDAQNSSNRLVTIPSDSKGCVRVGVLANKTVNNITVYPMIRLATDTNPEFTPYAMTNRELTEGVGQGILPILALSAVYGSEKPINIDSINNQVGYMYRIITSTGFSGTSPMSVLSGGNGFLLIGFSQIGNGGVIMGVQIAIAFSSNKIAIRNAPFNASGGTWGAWTAV